MRAVPQQFKRIYLCRLFDQIIELDERGTPISAPVANTPMPSRADSLAAARAASVDMKRTGAGVAVVRNPTPAAPPQPLAVVVDPSMGGGVSSPTAAANAATAAAALDPTATVWYRRRVKSEWRGVTAGGSPAAKGTNPENNPQYALQLTAGKPGFVFLTLTQPTRLLKDYALVCLLVLTKDGLRVAKIRKREVCGGELTFVSKREISVEVKLQPNVTYTVFACTLKAGVETPFTLTAYCRDPFAMAQIPNSVAFS